MPWPGWTWQGKPNLGLLGETNTHRHQPHQTLEACAGKQPKGFPPKLRSSKDSQRCKSLLLCSESLPSSNDWPTSSKDSQLSGFTTGLSGFKTMCEARKLRAFAAFVRTRLKRPPGHQQAILEGYNAGAKRCHWVALHYTFLSQPAAPARPASRLSTTFKVCLQQALDKEPPSLFVRC